MAAILAFVSRFSDANLYQISLTIFYSVVAIGLLNMFLRLYYSHKL